MALPKRIYLERFIWAAVCLISITTAVALLSLAWVHFQKDPVVTVTDSVHQAVWHYYYPSATICDINLISKQDAVRLAKKLKSSPDDKFISNMKFLMYLFAYKFYKIEQLPDLLELQDLLDKKNISVDSIVSTMYSGCNMLKVCKWKGEQKKCKSIFEVTRTTNGLCCSFNYYATRNSLFEGYNANRASSEPSRVSACGYQTGLELLMVNEPRDYITSIIPTRGLQAMIHSPYDYPDWNSRFTLIQNKMINFVSIDPTKTYCSPRVTNLPVERRTCYFHFEKKMYYFNRYSFHNCMVECRMNLTLKLCNCVPFYFIPIHEVNHQLGRTCNLRDVPCLARNFKKIHKSEPRDSETNRKECNCLPDCELVQYKIENTVAVLGRSYSMNHATLYAGVNITNQHSVVRIFFNDLVGTTNRRDVRINWDASLAFSGGLLGLFTGFSFISVLELIYFFTIRPITTLFKRNSNKVSKLSNERRLH
ncbi:unnamed protein product [Phyllotreta striolata]|uniref:Sodium channel protein Nach n=1 Tax=Phyllotreta striolata TaxID=444603 RepID=A0A9N9XJK6_PHYSR|nr:unnamed protein product [Phyllotreta striolata]